MSLQVRTVRSQLALFEAEVGRLNEIQASTREEWRSKTVHLQSELNQATTQKVDTSSQEKRETALDLFHHELSRLCLLELNEIMYFALFPLL